MKNKITLYILLALSVGIVAVSAFRCNLPESRLIDNKDYPMACKHMQSILFITQKNEAAQAAGVNNASKACKAILIDKHCTTFSKGKALALAQCRAFHAK